MTTSGELYVFEGPDGVGKSTLAHALTDHFEAMGKACQYLAFPGIQAGTLGRHVYDLHHNPNHYQVEALSSASLQLLHIAAHVDAIERFIMPALNSGQTLVLDRFWWSTWVYGVRSGVNRRALTSMIEVENAYWHTVLPTQAFLITRPTPFRLDRPLEQWESLRQEYAALAETQWHFYPVHVLTNDRSIDESLGAILSVLSENHE